METTTNEKVDITQFSKLLAWYEEQGKLYAEDMDALTKTYEEGIAERNKHYAQYLEARAKFQPASQSRKGGERHDQLCPICKGARHNASYDDLVQDGVKAVRVSFETACPNGSKQYILKDGFKGKLPLTGGQIAGIRKQHSVTVTNEA